MGMAMKLLAATLLLLLLAVISTVTAAPSRFHTASSFTARGAGAAAAHLPPQLRSRLPRGIVSLTSSAGGGGGGGSCPPPALAEIERTGRLSVASQGAAGNATGWRIGPAEGPSLDPTAKDLLAVDDSGPLRAALALSLLCDGAEVYLPPGGYWLATTVRVPDGVALVGGAGLRSHMQFMDTPQVSLYGPVEGPALLFQEVQGGNFMTNVMVHGQSSGVILRNVALVRFTDVGIKAAVNADRVNSSLLGCNVVLNSTNAALVIENSYWLWFERCSFQALGVGDLLGQRPVILMKGLEPEVIGVNNVYLVVFRDIVIRGGGIQYQQLADTHISQTGYWEFYNVVLESSAMPLLDVQSSPDVKDWPGLESITIIDFSNADSIKANFADIQNLNSVISLNCSQPGCALDGVTIVGG
jgi:hypothetical protein